MNINVPYPLNNPPLSDTVRGLKYIGPRFRRRFADQGITTLRELRDAARHQTLAQNTAMLKDILENARATDCVGEPRYRNDAREAGYYQYCVRQENQLAWYSVITYLLGKGVPQNRLPPAVRRRKLAEQCLAQGRCTADDPFEDLPQRYNRTPYTALDHIVTVMVADNVPLSSLAIWRRARRPQISSSRGFGAVLRANEGDRGRGLFRSMGMHDRHPTYMLKANVYNRIRNWSRRRILEYIRGL